MAKADWDRIEAEFRIGQKSVRELAREYDLTHQAIRKHMAKRGIEQDLTNQVRAVAAAEVVKAEVARVATGSQKVATAAEAVQVAGQVAAIIELRQRGRLGSLAQMAQALLGTEVSDKLSPEEQLAKRMGLLVKLVEVESKLVPLERKVYRLDDESGSQKSFEAWHQARDG